jgi:uncharacterized membrane protein (DUF4010 family)
VSFAEPKLPPVGVIGVVSLVCAFSGGIYLASNIEQDISLAPTVALLSAAAALTLAAIVLLSRLRDFAWDVFAKVAAWSALAYVVIIGMLEYVFIYNKTPGDQLVLMTLTLVVFFIDVPLLLAFGVAKYQPVHRGAGEASRALSESA